MSNEDDDDDEDDNDDDDNDNDDNFTPPMEPQSGVQAEPTFPETCRHGLHLHTMMII